MGLMTLLPTGRAFRKVQDQPGRYNLNHLGLPKFGPVKPAEPKTPTPAEENAAKPVLPAAPPTPASSSDSEIDRQDKTLIMKRIENVFRAKTPPVTPEAAPAPVADPVVPAPRKKGRFFFSGWTLFKNPFQRGAKPAKPERPGPVQPELRLDRVKPVRNDLSDSDIEVIPATTPAASGQPIPESEPKSIPLEPAPAPVEARWSGIRRQFRDAGKT